MSNLELSAAAREEIRKCVVDFVIVPGIVLTAVSFAVGFFVNEAARGKAYADSYSEASEQINRLVQQASTSSADVEHAKEMVIRAEKEAKEAADQIEILKQEIAQLSERINSAGIESEEAVSKLKATIAHANLAEIFAKSEDVVETLASSEQFQNAIGAEVVSDLQDLRENVRVNALSFRDFVANHGRKLNTLANDVDGFKSYLEDLASKPLFQTCETRKARKTYTALNDGFVIAIAACDANATPHKELKIYVNGSIRQHNTQGGFRSICCPVTRGDKWCVATTDEERAFAKVLFMPISFPRLGSTSKQIQTASIN